VNVIYIIVTVLLTAAAVLAVARIVRGPSMLDRVVATDVLLATLVGALGAQAAHSRSATTLPILVVLSTVGFVGSVTIARFASERQHQGRHR
jgi:multicomponent Na+:H+ antiporter subunit F